MLFQLSNGKLIKNGPGVFVEGIYVEWDRLLVIFEERISGLNDEEHILLRRNVED